METFEENILEIIFVVMATEQYCSKVSSPNLVNTGNF